MLNSFRIQKKIANNVAQAQLLTFIVEDFSIILIISIGGEYQQVNIAIMRLLQVEIFNGPAIVDFNRVIKFCVWAKFIQSTISTQK